MNNYTKELECKIYPAFQPSLARCHGLPKSLENGKHGDLAGQDQLPVFYLFNTYVLNNYHMKGRVLNIMKILLEYVWFLFIYVWKILLVSRKIIIFLHPFHLFLPHHMLPASHINKARKGKHKPIETKLMLRFPVTHPRFP